jgi:hypothetical protein
LNTNLRGAQPTNELAKEARTCRLSSGSGGGRENAGSQLARQKQGDMQRQTLSNFTDQCQFSKMLVGKEKSLWNECYYYTTK